MKGRKEVRGDVTKRKSITRIGTTQIAAGGKLATREMQNGGVTLKHWLRGH